MSPRRTLPFFDTDWSKNVGSAATRAAIMSHADLQCADIRRDSCSVHDTNRRTDNY